MKPTETSDRSEPKKPLKNKVLRARDLHEDRSHRTITPQIELFQHESSPSSHAVRNELSMLGLDFIAHNVSPESPLNHQRLLKAGGKDKIPFLIDHRTGIKLYESSAILAYLENEYGPKPEGDLARFFKEVDTRTRGQLEQLRWRLKVPVEQIRDYRHTIREGVETLRGTAKLIREAFRQAFTYPAEGAEGAAASQGSDEKAA